MRTNVQYFTIGSEQQYWFSSIFQWGGTACLLRNSTFLDNTAVIYLGFILQSGFWCWSRRYGGPLLWLCMGPAEWQRSCRNLLPTGPLLVLCFYNCGFSLILNMSWWGYRWDEKQESIKRRSKEFIVDAKGCRRMWGHLRSTAMMYILYV